MMEDLTKIRVPTPAEWQARRERNERNYESKWGAFFREVRAGSEARSEKALALKFHECPKCKKHHTSAYVHCDGLVNGPMIEWQGDHCPVPWGKTVEVQLHSGQTMTALSQHLRWDCEGHEGGIASYRVIEHTAARRAA